MGSICFGVGEALRRVANSVSRWAPESVALCVVPVSTSMLDKGAAPVASAPIVLANTGGS
eukprot:9208223-Prorocentrum_lima.AAC.1